MLKLVKATGDAMRLRIMTSFIKETGNGPVPPPFDETPADDIVLVGRVDPRLLSGTDPVYDHYSLVAVTEGSVFASNQEQSGVRMSQLAPKYTPRFANLTPLRVSTPLQIEMDTSMSLAPANQAPCCGRRQPPAAAAIIAPATAASVAPSMAAGVAPAMATGVAPAPATGVAPAPATGVAPIAANGRAHRRRQMRINATLAVAPPPSVSAYEAMLAEKSRINRIVGAEMIRLAKLDKMASVEASREKALYYELKRELASKKANEANVSEEYNTAGSILHTDALFTAARSLQDS